VMPIEDELREFVRAEARAVFEEMLAAMPAADADVPVTLKRASEITGIPRETFEKWVTQGRLRTHPCVGRLRMVLVSDITRDVRK
jgi:hypothetical protein